MKKFIIFSFVLVMVLSVSAFASDTRVMTMGDNNNVLLDDANIWLYPSRIVEYPNIVVAELGYFNSEFDQFGINWKMGEESGRVLGTYFSTHNSGERIDLFYGQDFGGNKFGVHLNLYQWSDVSENDTIITGNLNSEDASKHVDLTLGLTEASGKWDVALNFGFGSFTDKDDDGNDVTEPDGIGNMGIYGRYFQVKNPNYTMIHHASITTNKYGAKNSTSGDTYSSKMMEIDLGTGFNFTPSSHVLGVFDMGVLYSKGTYEATGATDIENKSFVLPYFKLGFDGDVFKWLDLRMGATSYWNNDKIEIGGESYTEKYASNDTYFGLGFNWGHLHVDTEANPEFFLDGPDFLSGADEDMAWSLSVTYEM